MHQFEPTRRIVPLVAHFNNLVSIGYASVLVVVYLGLFDGLKVVVVSHSLLVILIHGFNVFVLDVLNIFVVLFSCWLFWVHLSILLRKR